MNLKRGLLRLWLVASGLWVLFWLGFLAWTQVQSLYIPFIVVLLAGPALLFALGGVAAWIIQGFSGDTNA